MIYIDHIITGCRQCRDKEFPQQGHVYCSPNKYDRLYPFTILVRNTWYGFKSAEERGRFADKNN